mmetsp:Transcript_18370/g.44361  ORF Transcript_18370/g.44361 Transcript_18370/m.44361 type:complete len:745 (-) Transcript_18370:45-2279(-)
MTNPATKPSSVPAPVPVPALVFGASGEQGRAVLEGLVDSPDFSPVYGFSSTFKNTSDTPNTTNGGNNVVDDDFGGSDNSNKKYLVDALGVTLLEGRLNDPDAVRDALITTKAQAIFLASTYEMPIETDSSTTAGGYQAAEDEEYQTVMQFFDIVKQLHHDEQQQQQQQHSGGGQKLKRTVVFSTHDNVQQYVRSSSSSSSTFIEPLDDGSIVPHYSSKGKAGMEALEMFRKTDDGDDNSDLNLVLLTMPFFYSNFLAFFCPLPNNDKHSQWELSGSFGDGSNVIDMMSVTDLAPLVVNVFLRGDELHGKNLRIASERVSMDEIAKEFSNLFGKDVVYNPLLPKELASVEFPGAPAMAQMCQWLGEYSKLYPDLKPDLELTAELVKPARASPTNFETWLLTHSDATAFARVGLDRDAPEITKICVFGALSPQGSSVVKGLLADQRKSYEVRCTTRRDVDNTAEIQELITLDPKRVSFIQADFEDTASCEKAVEGMDGAFLVADLHETPSDLSSKEHLESEERHVRNIIDACEGRIRHLVFSTMESSEHVTKDLPEKDLLEFNPKARAAAYARSKNLSVTFLLVPIYTEILFDMMEVKKDGEGNDKVVMQMPGSGQNARMGLMSIDEIGPAVANIFDSYEVFAGHEIGLVTDFVTAHEVKQVIEDVFTESLTIESESVDTTDFIEKKDTYMRDLGQLFAGLSHSQAVASRHSLAETYKLCPNAKSLRRWVEQNRDNPAFREKLGLR